MERRDIIRLSILVIVAILGVLAFLLLKPFLLSIIGGLILAYIFTPLYKWLCAKTGKESISALLVILIAVLLLLIPVWFVTPIMVKQTFGVFRASQDVDFSSIVSKIFPTATESFVIQMSVALESAISKTSSFILTSLVGVFINTLIIILNLFVAGFVCYYALKDSDKLKKLVKDISPFGDTKDKELINQFKEITNAVIYGQIIVGVAQGVLAALGLLLFGIPNAAALGLVAIILSIVPIIGPSPVWIPVSVYLFTSSSPGVAIAYLLYNLIIVSTIDNILRPHIVSRRTQLSPAVILVGIIGGLFVFGLMGIILGPLILAYLIIFLQSLKGEYRFKILSEKKDKKKKRPLFTGR